MNILIVKENIINTYNSIINEVERVNFKNRWNSYVDSLKNLANKRYDEISKLRALDTKNMSSIKKDFDSECSLKKEINNSSYANVDIDFLSGYNNYLNDIVSILNNEYNRLSYKLKDSLPSKSSILQEIESLRLL